MRKGFFLHLVVVSFCFSLVGVSGVFASSVNETRVTTEAGCVAVLDPKSDTLPQIDFDRLPESLKLMGANSSNFSTVLLRISLSELVFNNSVIESHKDTINAVIYGTISDPFNNERTKNYQNFFKQALEMSKAIDRIRVEMAILNENAESFSIHEVVLLQGYKEKLDLKRLSPSTFSFSEFKRMLEAIKPENRFREIKRAVKYLPPLMLDEAQKIVALIKNDDEIQKTRSILKGKIFTPYSLYEKERKISNDFAYVTEPRSSMSEMVQKIKQYRIYNFKKKAIIFSTLLGLTAGSAKFGYDSFFEANVIRQNYESDREKTVKNIDFTSSKTLSKLNAILTVDDAVRFYSQTSAQSSFFNSKFMEYVNAHQDMSPADFIRLTQAIESNADYVETVSKYIRYNMKMTYTFNYEWLDAAIINYASNTSNISLEELEQLKSLIFQEEVKLQMEKLIFVKTKNKIQ